MRHELVLGLTFLVAAGSGCAEKPAPQDSAKAVPSAPRDVAPPDEPAPHRAALTGKPIPQDTARMERQAREKLEWNRLTLQGAYDKVGKRDPRWDASAREAMDLAARMFSEQVDPQVTWNEIYKPAKAAVDAGCDDPLLFYIYNRAADVVTPPGREEWVRHLRASAQALATSRYPVIRRAIPFELAGTHAMDARNPGEEQRKQARRDFDSALALLPESVANDVRGEIWEDRWYEELNEIIAGYRKLGTAPMAAFEKVDAELAKVPELKVLRLQVRAFFFMVIGGEARGQGFASEVPEGGFETLERCLGESRRAYEEAWTLRGDDARTATGLLAIEMSIGGDRATMELWFDRAMKADGNRYAACLTKLEWLDPKWHGTAEEMVAFGRACRATKNWRAGITLLCADAHHRYCAMLPQQEWPKYMGSPEVWSDLTSVFDEYLKHFPDHDVARSKYAAFAYMAGRYPESHAQFEILGDRLTSWTYFPYVPLPVLKRVRAEIAQRVGAKPPAGERAMP